MEHNKDFLESFTKASNQMIATSQNGFRSAWGDRQRVERVKDYTPDEIDRIVNSGSLVEQRKLSNNYFYKDGYYKQIIIYYATLLKYAGILIPNPNLGNNNLSKEYISKRYNAAVDYVEKLSLPGFCANCAQQALVNGSYYGVISTLDKTTLTVIDLPAQYCCSNYKDGEGNDLVEFNLSYFKTISDQKLRKQALKAYPKEITTAYYKWVNGKGPQWIIIPGDIGICFPLFDGRPMFLSVIPATIKYDDAMNTEAERNKEDIRKIIVQRIPHTNDNQLLFEPDEAAAIHKGTVGMLSGNKNLSVLTTYADVDAITSNTTADNASTFLKNSEDNIYAQAGVSGELFTSHGSTTLEQAMNNDLAMMMYLANKFARFITNAINRLFGNSNLTFKYTILPISYYNSDKYIDESFKLAGSGYSFLLPAIACGLSQRDLNSLKDLENNILKLTDKLKPLESAYTQSGDTTVNGRPKKQETEKAEQTIKNEKSMNSDQTTGGSN